MCAQRTSLSDWNVYYMYSECEGAASVRPSIGPATPQIVSPAGARDCYWI